MAPQPKDAGKVFLDRILSKVDPAIREQAAALLDNEQVLTEIGNGTLRLEDYSRGMQRLKATETEQQTWWNTHKGALEEYEDLKARGGRREPDPPPPPSDLAKRIEAQEKSTNEMLTRLETQGVSLTAALTHLGLSHLKEFDEVLDTDTLVRGAIEAGKPLAAFYNDTVATRRDERNKAALAKQIADAEERGRQAGREDAMKTIGQPYPVGDTAQPSTLSGITFHGKDATNPRDEFTLDAALRTLREETAKSR